MTPPDDLERLMAVARIAQASLDGCMWCQQALGAKKKGDKTAPCPNTYHFQLAKALKGLAL